MHFHRVFIRLLQLLTAAGVAFTAGVSGPLAASADSTMTIPVMGQQDPAWAGAPLGTSPTDTIGSAGCVITSVTMMLRYYGINTDPGALNAWLTGNGGYAFDDALVWDSITTYSGGRVTFSGWLGADLGTITNELDAGRPVVAEVRLDGNQHFVLLTGYSQDGGFVINDPWFADSVNFADRYGDPASGIVSIRTFMPADPGGEHGHGRVSWTANATGAVHLAQ
ncbi:MAG TPA: C39 family peptidase [Candidatus Dormibacteraeota bacterium]|nr:C39 family peptidase [Candidatus Dormibacteraeota bacterium]